MATKYIVDIERLLQLGILVPALPGSDAPIPSVAETAVTNDDDALFSKFLRLLPRTEGGGQRDIGQRDIGQRDIGQRDILGFIKDQPRGTTVPAIAEHFAIDQRQVLGKINGGLQKNIKKAGFVSIDPILWLEKRGGKWHYFPGEVLKRQPPIPS